MGRAYEQNESRYGYFMVSTVQPTGRRPLGISRRRCGTNIRVDLKGVCANVKNWID